MFESFEVGATFTIIDRASPVLTALIDRMTTLTMATNEAHAALVEVGKGVSLGNLTKRITAVNDALVQMGATAADVRTSFAADFDAIGAGLMIAAGNARELAAALADVRIATQGITAAAVEQRAAERAAGGMHLSASVPVGPMHARLTGGMAMAGLAGAVALGAGAVYGAEEQQSIMFALMGANINPASDRGKDLAAQMKTQAEAAARGTIFSYQEVASILPALVSVGLQPEEGTGTSIEKILPLISPVARFAESESMYGKAQGLNFDIQESALAAMKFAHLTGAYEPDKLRAMLDVMMPVSMATSLSPHEIVTSAKYILPLTNILGMDPARTVETMGLLSNLGQTGTSAATGMRQMLYGMLKEGSGGAFANQIADVLKGHGELDEALKGGASKGAARQEALQALGFTDAQGNRAFQTFDDIIAIAQRDREKFGPELLNELSKVLTIRGAQSFLTLAAPNAAQMWDAEKARKESFPGVDQFQQMSAQNSTVQQWQQFVENLKNLLNALVTNSGLLQDLNDILKGLNSHLVDAEKWMQGDHAKHAGNAVKMGAVGAAMGSIFGPLGTAAGGILGGIAGFFSPVPHSASSIPGQDDAALPPPSPYDAQHYMYDPRKFPAPIDDGGLLKPSAYRPGEGDGARFQIIINGAGMNPEQIAEAVMRKINQKLSNSMLNNQGDGAGVFGSYNYGVPI